MFVNVNNTDNCQQKGKHHDIYGHFFGIVIDILAMSIVCCGIYIVYNYIRIYFYPCVTRLMKLSFKSMCSYNMYNQYNCYFT